MIIARMAQNPSAANWASIGLLGLVWGGTFMIVSVALRDYGPVTVACARTTLGAAALLLLMRVMGRRWPTGNLRLWGFLVAIGMLSTALPFYLLSWGQQYVPSAFAGISMAALPLFVLPLAHVFADEPLTYRRTAGVIVGFVGAAVLIGPGVFAATGDRAAMGQLACVAAAFSYAVAAILTRRCPPIDPVVLSTLTLVVGSIVLIPAMLLAEGVPIWAGQTSGFAILFLGLMPTALAALLRVRDPQRGASFYDIGQLSGAALVDGLWRAHPVRGTAMALFRSSGTDHDGAGAKPVGGLDAAFRAERRSTTGLGLTCCRQLGALADTHGGALRLDSARGSSLWRFR